MNMLSPERLDELSIAYLAGNLPSADGALHAQALAPYCESIWLLGAGVVLGSVEPLGALRALVAHLRAKERFWVSPGDARAGFIRVTRAADDVEDSAWLSFRAAANRGAQSAGLPKSIAHSVIGALGELEANIHDHSGLPRSGLIAFLSTPDCFELVVLDRGIGVLESLRGSAQGADLADDDDALVAAIMHHRTRHGPGSGHGTGFLPLFRGLANTDAILRFRSGNAVLTLDGANRQGADIAPHRGTRPRGRGLMIATRWPRGTGA